MQNADWIKIKEVFHQTLDLPEGDRDAFLRDQSETIRKEVSRLIASHKKIDQFIVEPAVVDFGLGKNALVGKKVGNYTLIEMVGSGGMGTVFRAEKDGVGKNFAVKLIKRGMDTDAVLRRFQLERQILSQLDHPNIARLLDGGMTDEGLPFFVMEYIEGLPILKYCEVNGLDSSERLSLFRKICSAVSYAHQNLIVHRDLKPSNILITNDGTPKLLDFGIAKLLNVDGTGNTATATQGRIFTPEYASPEQLSGLPITTASDVFSLGVVLYELLSGQRPFQSKSGNHQEITNAVLSEEPPRPSSVVTGLRSLASGPKRTNENQENRTNSENPKSKTRNPKSLEGDLDNIILKSLRKETDRRYQSVQEFSEDIRRYLYGLPVTATADSNFYRFSKFVGRHRNAALVSSLLALLIFSISGIAIWQGIRATRERERAEKRFDQVRKLANIVLFEYHDGIANLPGATSIREKMVTDSLGFLDSLSAENDDDFGLMREVAAAYRKVGDIQGSFNVGNVGKTQESLQSYEKAAVIQEKLVRGNPENIDDQIMLGNLNLDIAVQVRSLGDFPAAEAKIRNAVEIYQKLPEDSKKQANLAKAFWNIGSLKTSQNDLDASLENYRKAIGYYEQLAQNDPKTTKYLRNVALTNKNIGSVLQLRGENGEAIECFKKALEIDLKNAAENPNDTSAQLDLSFSYGTIASAFSENEDFPAAEENLRKAIVIREKLFAADPKDIFTQNALASGFQRLAIIYADKKEFSKAVEEIAKAREIYQRISDADPENIDKLAKLAQNIAIEGNIHGLNKNLAKSMDSFSKSAVIFEKLLAQGKLSIFYQSRYADSLLEYSAILIDAKRAENALEQIKKAEDILSKIPNSKDLNEQKARIFELKADAILQTNLSSAGSIKDARILYQDALNILNSDSARPKTDKQLVKTLSNIKQKISKLPN